MATPAQWLEGARPRTLPAAIAPVVVGTGAAGFLDDFVWWKALLALGVAVALQVGVNYANDYSDGVRGTDEHRVGPTRLVGSKATAPERVKLAAFGCFGVGAVLGLALAATSGWWLLAVGVVAILAAWYYTGGSRPYGYRALGELAVFVFFGLVAVLGTSYVQAGRLHWTALAGAAGTGALACALLVANNLRDIPTDSLTGKRTLAVLLGADHTRRVFVGLLTLGFALAVMCGLATGWALLALAALPLALRTARVVTGGATGLALVSVLRDTGVIELVYAVGLGAGLALGG